MCDKRALTISIITALILSIAFHIGFAIDRYGELQVSNRLWYLSFLLTWLVMSALIYLLLLGRLQYIVRGLLQRKPKKNNSEQGSVPVTIDSKANAIPPQKIFLISWLGILVCWLPVFLAEYPGFFVYDATDEYIEVATRTFSTHHPLLHVLMLGGSVCAGNKVFGDFNIGIAAYILFQMIVISAIFAWSIYDRYTDNLNHTAANIKRTRAAVVISILWYGLFPTIVMFALCSAKDAFFAAFMLIAVVVTERILRKTEQTTPKHTRPKSTYIMLAVSLALMMLMRRNGVYGFLVYALICILFICVLSKKNKSAGAQTNPATSIIICAVLLCSLLGYKTADFALTRLTNAEDIENQEILTVPIQQLARTWSVYQDEMSKDQLDTLYEILDPQTLSHYTPNLSDPVKVDFNNEAYAGSPAKYRKLWWSLLKEHPLSYVNAWLNTCYGYFYPPAVVNVYAGHEVYTFTYTESSYFGYEVEYPGERKSMIPVIDSFYRWLSLDRDIQTIPVISFFFSMGGMFVIYVCSMGALIYQRKWPEVVALSLPMAVWLTLLLGPTFLPRYTIYLWFLLPCLLRQVFRKEENEKNYY